MTTLAQSDIDALNEAEVSEAAALSLRKQAEALEVEALALRQGVYRGWRPAPPPVVVPPPIPPVVIPPIVVPPVDPPAPPVYDVLPVFKSGSLGAWQVYNFTGKLFDKQLNLRRLSFVHVVGGTYETPDTSFYCDGGADIIVEGATFTGAPVAGINVQRCRTINSTRVSLRGCTVIGGLATTGIPIDQLPPLDSTGNVIGLPTGEGVYFGNCTDCGAYDCDISLLHQGIAISNSSVAIHDNIIHDLRTSPIVGSPLSGSTFIGNTTHTSTPWQYGGNGDHGDMLHLWADAVAIDGLVISDNTFSQGSGSAMLGVFLQSKNGGSFPNLDARGNTISTANGQGWRVDGCSGVIADTVLIWPGDHSDPKSEPRLDVNAPSHDLAVNGTKGIVTVDKGLKNITIDGVLQ